MSGSTIIHRFWRRHQADRSEDRYLRSDRCSLKGPELDKFGLVQFPMVMGGIVPVINLDGVVRANLFSTARRWPPSFSGR